MVCTAPMASRSSSLSRERALGSAASDDEMRRKSRASSRRVRMAREQRRAMLAALADDLGLQEDEVGEREEADEGQRARAPARARAARASAVDRGAKSSASSAER